MGMDRGAQCADRHPMARRQCRSHSQASAELAALAPDVILAHGGATVGPLLMATSAVPVVFVSVTDPVGAGFVDNLARPGGNATRFILFEYTLSGKWLELLKEIAPGVMRVAVLRDAPWVPALASSA
jgi:putative tryptophan/tyrosine transport system substrate-binding protein